MTLELAHQLALTKLVELLQSLTDPAEIRRVATAILRIKPPKNNEPSDLNKPSTPPTESPTAPTALPHHADQSTQPPSQPRVTAHALPSNLDPSTQRSTPRLPFVHPTPAAHLIAIAGTTHARRSDASFKPQIEERKDVRRAQSG